MEQHPYTKFINDKIREDIKEYIAAHSQIESIEVLNSWQYSEIFKAENRSVEGSAVLVEVTKTPQKRFARFFMNCTFPYETDGNVQQWHVSQSTLYIPFDMVETMYEKGKHYITSLLDLVYLKAENRFKSKSNIDMEEKTMAKNYTKTIKRRVGELMATEECVQIADVKPNGDEYIVKMGFFNGDESYLTSTIIAEDQIIQSPYPSKYIDNVIGNMMNDLRTAWNAHNKEGKTDA